MTIFLILYSLTQVGSICILCLKLLIVVFLSSILFVYEVLYSLSNKGLDQGVVRELALLKAERGSLLMEGAVGLVWDLLGECKNMYFC